MNYMASLHSGDYGIRKEKRNQDKKYFFRCWGILCKEKGRKFRKDNAQHSGHYHLSDTETSRCKTCYAVD